MSLSKYKIMLVYAIQSSCLSPVPATGQTYEKELPPENSGSPMQKNIADFWHRYSFQPTLRVAWVVLLQMQIVRAGSPGRSKAALLVIIILNIIAVTVEVAIEKRCWSSQRQKAIL